jgi:hypothetical protein
MTFRDLESCKKFVEAEKIEYNGVPLLRKYQKDYFEGKAILKYEFRYNEILISMYGLRDITILLSRIFILSNYPQLNTFLITVSV